MDGARQIDASAALTRKALLVRAGAFAAGALAAPVLSRPALAAPTRRSPATASFEGDVAQAWFDLVLRLVRETPGFSPPVASRALGYAGVTLYEAVLPGMPEHRTLAGQLNAFAGVPRPPGANTVYHWPSVANSALAEIVRSLFASAPASVSAADALESRLAAAYAPGVAAGIGARSAAYGRSVGAAVHEWSRTDGGHRAELFNFPADYVPPAGTGLWVPTAPGFQRALQPRWGAKRSFVLRSGGEFLPAPHAAYSEQRGSAFHEQALEVYDAVNNLTPAQRELVEYWADDPGRTSTPPGHAVSILGQVLSARGASLALAAEAYAKVGIAVADAFVSCWHAKYQYNLLRPITYIRDVVDPAWGDPLPVATPPFPEYTSGHSVQSATSCQVLSDLFGNVPFDDRTHERLGFAARRFASFEDCAAEAAISRLYGGIHFRDGIEQGLEQGRLIGRRVSALRFRA